MAKYSFETSFSSKFIAHFLFSNGIRFAIFVERTIGYLPMSAVPTWEKAEAKTVSKGGNSFRSRKLVVYGVPIFLIQVVVIYFITTNLFPSLTSRSQIAAAGDARENPKSNELVKEVNQDPPTVGREGAGIEDLEDNDEEHIHVVKELIVNPAGTHGTRFFLTTIGFQMSNAKAKLEMEKKDIQIRDILNTILTSKTLDQLIAVEARDSLRSEISTKVQNAIKSGRLQNVFFSKFIIQ